MAVNDAKEALVRAQTALTNAHSQITQADNSIDEAYKAVSEALSDLNSVAPNPDPTPPNPNPPVTGKVVWRGDYETGDFSQYKGVQRCATDRAQIITSPVRQGSKAAKYIILRNDPPVATHAGATSQRSEASLGARPDYGNPGQEEWWAFSTLWKAGWQPAAHWNIFGQFHHTGSTGQPTLAWHSNNDLFLTLCYGDPAKPTSKSWRFAATFEKDKFYDFMAHVKWSSDPKVGFLEAFMNGKRMMALERIPTLYAGQAVYFKQGLYRGNQGEAGDVTIVHDGARFGTSYAAVVKDFATGWPSTPPA